MLSRLSIRSLGALSGRLPQTTGVRGTATGAAQDGERDLVNFPRRSRPIYPGAVRLGFIPEEWFTALYNKTGVTGPYMVGVGLSTFLFSKEIYIIEHEFHTGLTLAVLGYIAIKKFGPSVSAALDASIEEDKQMFAKGRTDTINSLKEGIAEEQLSCEQAKVQPMLYQAKKENIGLQLEAAYRERLQDVHNQVKKKLDYQLETSNVKSRFEQKHMVDWIVQNVVKSITPAQETASLKRCISDLKSMAAKA